MIKVEATSEEWAIIRQTLSRGCAHVGSELAGVGMPGVSIAAQTLSTVAAFDARLEQALQAEGASPT